MKQKLFQGKIKIISQHRISKDYFRIILNSPQIARLSNPGQFIEIKVTDSLDPFLRIPFSIHKVRAQRFEVLYKIVGRGTEILSSRSPGEYLDVIGPLGNGFSIFDSCFSILVAGGIGVAPLFFLAQRLREYDTRGGGNIIVLIGAKTKREILCKKEFADLALNVKISTDDGSAGFKGKITELLRHVLPGMPAAYDRAVIYACGPRAMLKEIGVISKQFRIPTQASLDEYMACGMGVCLGCIIKTNDGYKRVCRDGPVFDLATIIQ